LLPVKEAQRALGRRQQLSVALLSVTVALLVMVVPYALQGRRIAQLDGEISQLKIEIARFNEQTREVRDLEKKRAELQAKLRVIDDLKQKRVGPVRMLEDLSTATPQKLWIVQFNEVNGLATITGMALDNQTSQSEPLRGPLGGNGGMIFKKFIVKAHLDYLGMGGKTEAAPNVGRPTGEKTGT